MSDGGDSLGSRQASGKLGTDAGGPYGVGKWVVTFDPATLAVSTGKFEIYHLSLTGPAGSTMQMWVDRTFYDITNHGDINSWDPNSPLTLLGGQTIYMYWNSAVTPAPFVTVWLRQQSVITQGR